MRTALVVAAVLVSGCDQFAGTWKGTAVERYDNADTPLSITLDLGLGRINGTSTGPTGYKAKIAGDYQAEGVATMVFTDAADGGSRVQASGGLEVIGGQLVGNFTFTTTGTPPTGTISFDLPR